MNQRRPLLRIHPQADQPEPVVITGIGMITSLGDDRETVWRNVCRGRSGVRKLDGLEHIPDGLLVGAPVDIEPEYPGQLKVLTLALKAADEAMDDSRIDPLRVDPTRFGCAVSGHMGDTAYLPFAQQQS